MALHLNLLHEEIHEERQRRRDPLKIGLLVLICLGGLMFIYYMWNAYQTLQIKGRLGRVQADWAQIEPKVTAAQKRAAELNGIIKTMKLLDERIEGRFYWAPFLQQVAACVAPNTQVTTLQGEVSEEKKTVSISLEGVAAGREPRAAAEDLRQLLQEQLGGTYKGAKVQFRTLEDLDTLVNVGGANVPMARFVVTIDLAKPEADREAAPKK